ncbi:MAG TPA: hydratase [Bauldia sp.]|nr:hydratase [Bauldia sp.]
MADISAIADRILAARDAGKQIAPISDGDPAFDLAAGYAVGAEVMRRRVADGERQVGWKIGFTNRTIWDEYGVHAPIYGPMYHDTVHEVPHNEVAPGSLHGLLEPRLEPEIVFRFSRSPEPAMDVAALFDCIDGVALGFEIVQSIYPGWRFRPADTVAAFGLHGRLYHGTFSIMEGGPDRQEWLPRLANFDLTLSRGGQVVDRGRGANVLDGPLYACRHFIAELDRIGGGRVKPGDVVTTGTITRAWPVMAGEQWTSHVEGPWLPVAFSIRF